MEKELIELLKKNLHIEVTHPEHDIGYYGPCMEPDEHNITVSIHYGDILISESTSY